MRCKCNARQEGVPGVITMQKEIGFTFRWLTVPSMASWISVTLKPQPKTQLNNFVQATPVCTILFVPSQVPGAPDDNRSIPA